MLEFSSKNDPNPIRFRVQQRHIHKDGAGLPKHERNQKAPFFGDSPALRKCSFLSSLDLI